MDTGEPFLFDTRSIYGHKGYEIGDWRLEVSSIDSAANSTSKNYQRDFRV